MNQSPKPYQLIIMIAGGLMLIFSFLEWFGNGEDYSAWSSGLLPLATLAPVFGTIMAIHAAVSAFGNSNLPDRVMGFTWNQIHLVLAFYAVLIMFGYLITENFDADRGIGLIFNLLGAIALMVGAIMQHADRGGVGGTTTAGPPQSF